MQPSLFLDGFLPQVHYAGSLTFSAGEPFYKSLHHHPDVTEILLICEGSGEYQIGETQYPIEPQSLVVYNQGVWHEERSFEATAHRMLYIGFSRLQVHGLAPGMLILPDAPPVIPLRDRYLHVEDKFREILHEHLNPSAESAFISSHLLAALLAELARVIHYKDSSRKNRRSSQVVDLVKHYVQENYNQAIELRDFAAITYLSPYHLSRLFKQEAGVSPMHYVQQYRMEVAKHLLSASNETVAEIAHRVGYQSEQHFQNVFKRLIGLAPGAYRRKQSELEI